MRAARMQIRRRRCRVRSPGSPHSRSRSGPRKGIQHPRRPAPRHSLPAQRELRHQPARALCPDSVPIQPRAQVPRRDQRPPVRFGAILPRTETGVSRFGREPPRGAKHPPAPTAATPRAQRYTSTARRRSNSMKSRRHRNRHPLSALPGTAPRAEAHSRKDPRHRAR